MAWLWLQIRWKNLARDWLKEEQVDWGSLFDLDASCGCDRRRLLIDRAWVEMMVIIHWNQSGFAKRVEDKDGESQEYRLSLPPLRIHLEVFLQDLARRWRLIVEDIRAPRHLMFGFVSWAAPSVFERNNDMGWIVSGSGYIPLGLPSI